MKTKVQAITEKKTINALENTESNRWSHQGRFAPKKLKPGYYMIYGEVVYINKNDQAYQFLDYDKYRPESILGQINNPDYA